jgi:hypothetical protein
LEKAGRAKNDKKLSSLSSPYATTANNKINNEINPTPTNQRSRTIV